MLGLDLCRFDVTGAEHRTPTPLLPGLTLGPNLACRDELLALG
jgi:hypothetical protein